VAAVMTPLVAGGPEVAHRGRQPVSSFGVERFCAWLVCRSRKPSISEPARPNSEDENENPHAGERSGKTLLRASKVPAASPPTLSPSKTLPTDETVSIRPQKVRAGQENQAGRSCSATGHVPRQPRRDRIRMPASPARRSPSPDPVTEEGGIAQEDRRAVDRKPRVGQAEPLTS